MKTRRIVDIVLGLAALFSAGYFIYSRYINPPVQKKEVLKVIKANDILKYKTVITPAIVNTALTSAACTSFMKEVAEKSMMEFANEFIDHHYDEILKTCAGAVPTSLQVKLSNALFKCKDSLHNKISNECFGALLAAKTSSVASVIRPDISAQELSAPILLHLIAEKFSNGDFLEHPEKSLEIVDALLDKEPSYLGGYKAKMMLLSMSSLAKDEHYKNELKDTLDQAKRLNPNDLEIREMEIAWKGDVFNVSESKKDQSEFLDYLNREGAKHPQDWMYDYYKAVAVYQNGKGNYEEALALVEMALKKSPNNPRLKNTVENMKSDDEQRRGHPFILSVGFSLDDL
jgi:tetratricopeptide (TPR) repeat protein